MPSSARFDGKEGCSPPLGGQHAGIAASSSDQDPGQVPCRLPMGKDRLVHLGCAPKQLSSPMQLQTRLQGTPWLGPACSLPYYSIPTTVCRSGCVVFLQKSRQLKSHTSQCKASTTPSSARQCEFSIRCILHMQRSRQARGLALPAAAGLVASRHCVRRGTAAPPRAPSSTAWRASTTSAFGAWPGVDST